MKALAVDAYEYAFPLVMMDVSRRQATNVPDATSVPGRAPANQFAHHRSFPDADAKEVVRFNFDTLYSMAWLDLRAEPVVLTVPDATDRYYLTPMLDMWSDVIAVPGTRTTGGTRGEFLIAGPGWDGAVPEGVRLIRSTTPFLWVIGRTQTNGPADYAAVHAVQDQYRIVPLSLRGTPYSPPVGQSTSTEVDDITPPQAQVWNMSGVEFFTYVAELLALNPPHANDYPILFQLEQLDITPGKPFTSDAALNAALNDAVAEAKSDIISAITDGLLGTARNGWQWMQSGSGAYGTSYRLRAMVAYAGLGANLPEDALYPNRATDSTGELLTGQRQYTLHFDATELPPADAFWSLTMYDNEGFQIPNPINRFAIGDRDALTYNTDGSLDLLIQQESPGPDSEANWLPAPSGAFQLTLRIYSPKADVFRHGLSLPQPERSR